MEPECEETFQDVFNAVVSEEEYVTFEEAPVAPQAGQKILMCNEITDFPFDVEDSVT